MKSNYRKLFNLLAELNDIEGKIRYNVYLAKKFNKKYHKENDQLILIQNKLLEDIEQTIKGEE